MQISTTTNSHTHGVLYKCRSTTTSDQLPLDPIVPFHLEEVPFYAENYFKLFLFRYIHTIRSGAIGYTEGLYLRQSSSPAKSIIFYQYVADFYCDFRISFRTVE